MPEGGHEDPERGGVEQPVGRRPSHRLAQQHPVLHQHGEAAGQSFEQRREAVGVEEADVGRDTVDDTAGPLLAPGEQVEESPEGAEEYDPDGSGHHHQDGGRGRAVRPRHPEPVGHEEPDQRAPEDDVEHHGRADALGPEGEARVGTGHAGLGHQPVPEGGAGGRAARRNVAEGQGREVDPEEAEAGGAPVGEDRVGELGVGHQRSNLQQQPQGQVGHVDVGERPDLAAVAGQQRDGHVEGEQEHQDGADAEAHLTTHEGSSVPPPTVSGRDRRSSLEHCCRLGRHHLHVDTERPLDLAC